MKTYTIKEVTETFHLPASTLRYYEDMGILPQIARSPSGQRIYTEEHIGRLHAVCCFKRAGLTLSDIRKFFLLEDEKYTNIDEILSLLEKNKAQIETKLNQLAADYRHINEKLSYYNAIKQAIENEEALPSWQDYMD